MRKLAKEFENPSVYILFLVVVILCTLSYWTYLYFTTEMSIAQDAVGYENSGRVVAEQGWRSYFKGAPEREPLYIFTIAFSMKMGNMFGLNYQHFQKLIQVMLFFFAQLLLVYLHHKLRVHNLLKILTIIYFGISPAIVNGAFSLYSEIIVYPFVLLAVILLGKSWQAVYESSMKQCVVLAVLTAACLLILTFGKGIFRFISMISLLPFLSIFLRAVWAKQWGLTKKALVYILIVIFVVNAGVFVIQSLNEKYNGNFVYTGRYNFLILGSAIKRTRPLNKEIVLSHIASIPGAGICGKMFNQEICDYADWYGSVTPFFPDQDSCKIHSSEYACAYAQRYRSTDPSGKAILDALELYPEHNKPEAYFTLALIKIVEHPFRFAFITSFGL